jgi:hypothetical protein
MHPLVKAKITEQHDNNERTEIRRWILESQNLCSVEKRCKDETGRGLPTHFSTSQAGLTL